jgi:hypothetical protein
MSRHREQVISDVSSGDLTERIGIGAVERHRAVAHSDNPLSMAIDRLRAEARAKDVKHEEDQEDFSPATARTVTGLLLEVAESTYPAELADLSGLDKRKLALMALMERTIRRCNVCRGRRELKVSDVETIICTVCMGSGKAYAPTPKMRDTAFGRKLGHKEKRAMRCLLSTWDNNEHGTAGSVEAMYAAEEA